MAEIVPVDLKSPELPKDVIEKIKLSLTSGKVIAFPTDTFYGLGVDPFNDSAVSSLFKIKNRPADKPILVLIGSIKQLGKLTAEISPDAEKLMKGFWPGPLTILFKALPSLPASLTAGSGKIGVRLPSDEIVRRILESVGHPLTAPSANVSGGGNLNNAEEVNQNMGTQLDLILDGGKTRGGKVSTVIDTTVSPSVIIREGAVSKEKIESVLNI